VFNDEQDLGRSIKERPQLMEMIYAYRHESTQQRGSNDTILQDLTQYTDEYRRDLEGNEQFLQLRQLPIKTN
jgi:hypothetical protein